MKKRWSSLLLCAAMFFSLCAPAAAVEDGAGETYIAWTWNGSKLEKSTPQIPGDITEITAENVGSLELNETTGGWYIVRDNDVSESYGIAVTGAVNLILADGCSLKARGIKLRENSSLSIYAQSDGENMGELTTTFSGSYNAGIEVNSGSTVTIHGGKVTADGWNGAGISGYNEKAGGSVNILGGTVAASSWLGAGIGGGWHGAGGEITISGGMVTATSQSYGAGIGGGQHGSGGKITITGGEVTATGGGGDGGAGIGGGAFRDGGEITITGGTVEATSTNGAGIGGGATNGAGGKITISGGTVEATSSYGAGIGSGASSDDGGNFTADGNAFIVATGGGSAAAIGDQTNSGSWSGVIFEGDSGNVYGSEITLAADAEIPAGKELEIEAGKTLIIGEGVTLTNNGTIANAGTINNNGKIINSGTISGAGIIVNNGTITGNEITGNTVHEAAADAEWQHDGSGHWHPCKVEGCTAHKFDTDVHTPGDWIVDKAATSTEAGQRHKACTACGYVTATETIPATGGGSGGDGDGGGSGGSGGGGGGGSYTPPTYKPEVSKPSQGGGTPSISPSDPARGDTVTVTPKPDEGYEVDKITVTDKNGKPVEVTKKPDGTYTFKQPGGKVKIEVSYKQVNTPWNNPFADVPKDAWYYEAVRFVCERGLMNGYSDGRFGPNDTLSRAQLAQILFNKEGQPAGSGQSDFTDVAGEAWYSAAVRWAADQGIVGGYGDGTFGPNAPITREQLAVMLWRYSGSPDATDKELHFNDMGEISGFALEAMRWAVENGILNGYGDGQLGPQGQATRAQVAQMLKNFIENQGEDT